MSAGRKHHDNAVSGFDFFYPIPRTFDDSCALMPVYGRVLDREKPIPRKYIRLADPARRDPDQHLAAPGSASSTRSIWKGPLRW